MNETLLTFANALEGQYGWVIELVALLLLVFIINVVLKWVLLKLHSYFEASNSLWKDSFVTSLLTPLTSFVWLIALVQLLNVTWERLRGVPLFTTSHAIIKIGAILVTSWFLLRWKKSIVNKTYAQNRQKHLSLDKGKIDAINKLLTVLICFFAALLLLEQLGSNMNTLIAFGGVSGLAVAFASQQIIANFFGGLMIYFTHPFAIGDWINLPEKNIEGHVEEIGWYTTRIRTFDKRPIYIPNSMLTNILVMNPSRMTHRRVNESIFLRYQDIQAVPKIIQEIKTLLIQHPKIEPKSSVQVHFTAFGAQGLEIKFSAYTKEIDKYLYQDVLQEILLKIATIIEEYGADFAIPLTGLEFPKGIPFTNHD